MPERCLGLHRCSAPLLLSCIAATLQLSLSAGLAGRATFYGNGAKSLQQSCCCSSLHQVFCSELAQKGYQLP